MSQRIGTERELMELGGRIHTCLGSGEKKPVVYLRGELGAGKTTVVRGFLRAAGCPGAVKSPTFALVEEYLFTGFRVAHFDLYRLTDAEELEWIGIRDYLDNETLCFVEWPDRGSGCLPPADLVIHIRIVQRIREIELTAESPLGNAIRNRYIEDYSLV